VLPVVSFGLSRLAVDTCSLAERALAHTIANKVKAAYHRADWLQQRRPLMEAWVKHGCCVTD
jgi:hypothetical protein